MSIKRFSSMLILWSLGGFAGEDRSVAMIVIEFNGAEPPIHVISDLVYMIFSQSPPLGGGLT
jgi:hypothetical protein